ncbi:ABC transporter permease [Mesorhizobium sp. M7A.F.Ca.US.011.01.1.1]|uniref:ABC transporter permease n=1 Tax=Mesorhizobium sp. M7A.F.Ca.US.011.01.1.1 TaxID=2496741 RepID=UPI000FCA6DDC|nr:ABC transporter permease [Mesorhizobium sp. M7A.F.Ca.US.011.01.1.1]RUX22132.1 ABC transporter permease [Mesorhizobium sp. M7A.F.Ca.US.011.01.1.1]
MSADTKPRSGLRLFMPEISALALVAPAVIFLLLFFVLPLVYITVKSLQGGSFASYLVLWESPAYLNVIVRTFAVCAIVTVVTLVLAYPYAYLMTVSSRLTVIFLSAAILLPFWVSLLLRSYAWLILLQNTGLINKLLLSSGLIDKPVPLVRNLVGVTVGMTHVLLPYAVLPLYSIMSKIDPKLMEAAAINGAGPIRTFWRVYLPLSFPGIVSAAVLVFTLGLGFYITPALLGGSGDIMIGQLIASSVQMLMDLPFASALSVVLLALTGCVFGVFAIVGQLTTAPDQGGAV